MKNKKKDNKSLLLGLIVGIVTFILVFGGYFVYTNYIKKDNRPKVVNDLIKEKEKEKYKKEDPPVEVETPYVNELPDYRNQYGNPSIMARLEVPNLNINTLVTRTTNNEYYLNYNLYNQYDGLGAPFIDFRNTSLNTDRQINIYGHNTQNSKFYDRLPFINLEAYTDENIFKNYKDINLYIDERLVKYHIVAIKIVDNSQIEHMKLIFYSDDDFVQHANKLLSNTLFKEDNAKVDANDRLLVLQVCHYNPVDTYLLVIAKEVKK